MKTRTNVPAQRAYRGRSDSLGAKISSIPKAEIRRVAVTATLVTISQRR